MDVHRPTAATASTHPWRTGAQAPSQAADGFLSYDTDPVTVFVVCLDYIRGSPETNFTDLEQCLNECASAHRPVARRLAPAVP